ncbi:MAG: chromate reductase, partial [Oceanospirillaceae bacterium]
MKLLAFAASNSTKSINKQLATFTTTLIEHTQVELLDLNDYEMPIYSEDREQASGIPAKAQQF